MKHEGASFLLAVQFLTRIPIPSQNLFTPERMAASVRYYPMVGILVGGISAGAFLISQTVFPQIVAVMIAVVVGLLLTGGFHEDGLADTFDGIGGGLDRERALKIMKDSRLGTYGTVALIVALSLKVAALSLISADLVASVLIVGHGLSRLSSVLVISTSSYVREQGAGKPVAESASIVTLMVAVLTGFALVMSWGIFNPLPALLYMLLGLAAGHVLMRLFFEPKLRGYTGDTLGAVQQGSEIGIYLGILAWL